MARPRLSAPSGGSVALGRRRGHGLRPPRALLDDYFASVTCPRISPPGFAAVWMLKYHWPASRSLIWSSVSVALPFIGLARSAFGTGSTGGPEAPTPPLWKWAATAGPVRPE